MDQFLKVQEQLVEELQKEVKMLTENNKEHRNMIKEKTNEVEQLKQNFKILQNQAEEKDKCFNVATDQIFSLEKQKMELENSIQKIKQEIEVSYLRVKLNFKC